MTTANLADFFTRCQTRIQTLINTHIPDNSEQLNAAMRYSTLNGGKRFRPALSYALAEQMNRDLAEVDAVALAVELIHCYSLVHDDLPAMDDDALRRGQPTCHIAFDEATAILVGDALQPMAFELITQADYAATTKVTLIQKLAQAAGSQGMVLGQALDMQATAQTLSLQALERVHHYKTGQLIRASLLMAATALNVSDVDYAQLDAYSHHLGIMFQISDDILDVTSDTQTLGKPQGSDTALEKNTYVSILGLEGASEALDTHYAQAEAALDALSLSGDLLHGLMDFVVKRKH